MYKNRECNKRSVGSWFGSNCVYGVSFFFYFAFFFFYMLSEVLMKEEGDRA